MAQRTVFPQIPNTPDVSYPGTLQAIYQEIERQGGCVPFKKFRPWLKERNIYDKEQVDELFFFIGCTFKPDVALGDFARRFLTCETPEAQQRLLYEWLHAWNPFLTKYVFEALDVDSGGRLHSTHELYRMITSYVYAGEYVTLPSFQNWIKWMAAAGCIRYIGIRWGLSELGKAEMKNIRMLDVDEMLEDEAEEAEAADSSETVPIPARNAEAESTPPPATESADPEDEELPDMPPEAPIPDWEPPSDHPLADVEEVDEEPRAAPDAAPPKKKAKKGKKKEETKASPVSAPLTDTQHISESVARVVKWFAGVDSRPPDGAADFGLEAKQYGKNPPLFLYKLSILAQLVVGRLPVSVWEPLYRQFITDQVFDEYFGGKRALEALVHQQQWYEGQPALRDAFSSIAFDLMRGKATLRGQQALCDQLEDAPDGPALLRMLHQRVFMSQLTVAPFWMVREMAALGIWDHGDILAYTAVPTAQVRANACRLGLISVQEVSSFDALIELAFAMAKWFPNGDHALHYVHNGLEVSAWPTLKLPYRESV